MQFEPPLRKAPILHDHSFDVGLLLIAACDHGVFLYRRNGNVNKRINTLVIQPPTFYGIH